mmetsp:Transcript_36524/g.94270  ORF Transcript_36524/g.94270 Transcript_36524/m.94270 type:complete len:330 (+) Transcript_36524:1462-2451(+)
MHLVRILRQGVDLRLQRVDLGPHRGQPGQGVPVQAEGAGLGAHGNVDLRLQRGKHGLELGSYLLVELHLSLHVREHHEELRVQLAAHHHRHRASTLHLGVGVGDGRRLLPMLQGIHLGLQLHDRDLQRVLARQLVREGVDLALQTQEVLNHCGAQPSQGDRGAGDDHVVGIDVGVGVAVDVRARAAHVRARAARAEMSHRRVQLHHLLVDALDVDLQLVDLGAHRVDLVAILGVVGGQGVELVARRGVFAGQVLDVGRGSLDLVAELVEHRLVFMRELSRLHEACVGAMRARGHPSQRVGREQRDGVVRLAGRVSGTARAGGAGRHEAA